MEGLLDLYQKEKEKNKELKYLYSDEKIRNTIIKRYREVIEKDYIVKDKIREKIKEIHNYTFMSNEEMKQQDYAIIKLEELLEEN